MRREVRLSSSRKAMTQRSKLLSASLSVSAIALIVAVCSSSATAEDFVFGTEDFQLDEPVTDQAAPQGEIFFSPEEQAYYDNLPPADVLLDEGLRYYDQKNFRNAALEFSKIVNSPDPEAERYKQEAEYSLAKSLFFMGLPQTSLAWFDRIVQVGRAHRHYSATLQWLYLISRQLPDPAISDKIGLYDRNDFPDKFSNQLNFMVGHHFYRVGDLNTSLDYLRAVNQSNVDAPSVLAEEYVRAKFMEGVLWIRRGGNEGSVESNTAAMDAFKEVLRATLESPELDKEFSESYQRRTLLNMARVFYANGQVDLALKYYAQVPRETPEWLDALMESSWAHFLKNDFDKALGNLHSLDSPYFEAQYYPEAEILRAIIFFYNCHYSTVRTQVEKFSSKYGALQDLVQSYLQQNSDPNHFYEFLIGLNKQDSPNYSVAVQRVFNVAFDDNDLARLYKHIGAIDREIKVVRTLDEGFRTSPIGVMVAEELSMARSFAVYEAGRVGRARLERMSEQLRELLGQARRIQFETATAEKGMLESQLRDQSYSSDKRKREGNFSAMDDDHLFWPFEGEYWKDELGSYLYNIQSMCGR